MVPSGDLYITKLGINDATSAVAAATVGANIDAIVQYLKARGDGDILIVAPTDCNGADYTTYLPQYAAQMLAVAQNRGCAFINLAEVFGSYATQNARGAMFDSLHPNSIIYAEEAQMHAHYLMAA